METETEVMKIYNWTLENIDPLIEEWHLFNQTLKHGKSKTI